MKLLRPVVEEQNLYVLAQPLFDALNENNLPFGVVGSVGLAPQLLDAATTDGHHTYVEDELWKSNCRRKREVGDIDIEFPGTDLEALAESKALTTALVAQAALEVDFSHLYPSELLEQKRQRPFGNLKVGVTDTYVEADSSLIRAGALFGVPISDESMTLHTIHHAGGEFTTYGRATLIARYLCRSELGIPRLRNQTAINKAVTMMLKADPSSRDWLMDPDGPGHGWIQLAQDNLGVWSDQSVRLGNPDSHKQCLLIVPRPLQESVESEDFLYTQLTHDGKMALVTLTRLKLLGLIRPVEHSKALDAIWSQFLMPIAGNFIHPSDKAEKKMVPAKS